MRMRTTTHIEALTDFATALHDSVPQARKNSDKPLSVLSTYVGLSIQSYQFTRVLTWVIAFYYDAVSTLDGAEMADRNRDTAKTNLHTLFAPFLPPFDSNLVSHWYAQSMSAVNVSYFDLLNDVMVKQHPIYIPGKDDLESYRSQLKGVLIELAEAKLPKWIERDFEDAIQLTLLAIEKLPFVAHRLIREAHSSILGRLFDVVSPDHKKLMVKVATIVNLVMIAFVMPHEGSEAIGTYYGWMAESPVDVKQIEACARPLALPAPDKSG
jgi:hypothetical protein